VRIAVRQYLFLILFVIVLAAPFALRAIVKTPEASNFGEGTVPRLVVITPNNQDIRREFARAFSEWHAARFGTAVEIDFRTPGGTNDIKRQLADTYKSWQDPQTRQLDPRFVPDVHVVWGGGDYHFNNELKPLGLLQSMRIDPALLRAAFPEPDLAGVALYDRTVAQDGTPTPQWVGVCLSAFGIAYNPDVYAGLGLPPPTQWHDLTDARLAGQLALADPTHSGSAATAYMVILQRRMADAEAELFAASPAMARRPKPELASDPKYQQAIAAGWKRGMGELLLIAANSRYFTDSSPQVPNDVSNGDAAAGIAIDFYGRVYEEAVGPQRCRMITPVGATAITSDPVAILAGVRGEPLELARHFVDFLLSPEGQRIWILKPGTPGGPVERALRRPPVRRDLYTQDRTGWTDDTNPFTEAGGFNQRNDFMRLFADTRSVWAAAWIDGRERLKRAYAQILRVPDAARRGQLLVELADLPITMPDVAAFSAQRKQAAERGGSPEEWNARKRIELTKTFRAHYDAVAAKAR
jgi:ABC-type Fe3+ transport system substrate-binding protein